MVRRWLYWLLVVAFAWLVYRHWGELQQLQTTLARGRWGWIAAAVGLQFGFYLILTWLYQVTLAVFEVKSRFRQLWPITFAAVFVNLSAPTGGTAGPALFVQEERNPSNDNHIRFVSTALTLLDDTSQDYRAREQAVHYVLLVQQSQVGRRGFSRTSGDSQ